jgi:osmotically-inducible protein OsmY
MEEMIMLQAKCYSFFFLITVLTFSFGCAATRTQESTGQYIDDTAITASVKAAIFNDPALKSAEINVETFKGVVQLTGFVSSKFEINRAVEVARSVNGVRTVRQSMIVK